MNGLTTAIIGGLMILGLFVTVVIFLGMFSNSLQKDKKMKKMNG